MISQGELYLSRRINTQLDPNIMQSIEWESLKDRLALEIQRSLDYYESQMGQIPINRIVIAQRQYDGAALAAELNGVLSAEVSVLSLSDHLNSTTELTAESQQIGMAAIGATLRTNKKSGRSRKPKQEAA